jgi:hypothetical protein
MNLVSANIPVAWLWVLWTLAALLGILIARRAGWRMLKDGGQPERVPGRQRGRPGPLADQDRRQARPQFPPAGRHRPDPDVPAPVRPAGHRPDHRRRDLWQGEYAAFAANWLLMGAVPVGVSWALFRLIDGKLPNHLFIYVFLNAFFGAALAVAAVGLASTAFAALAGAYPLGYLLDEYLPYYLLMAWAEAFATGMLITVMVVYKPEWVATFDDRRYLLDK